MSRSDHKSVDEGTLAEVLEVERQIQSMLDAETAKARASRERSKRDTDDVFQSDVAEMERERARRREASDRAARDKAADIVERARAVAERIERLPDDRLEAVVRRHIAAILPEGDA